MMTCHLRVFETEAVGLKNLKTICVFELGAHATFQNPTTTHSRRMRYGMKIQEDIIRE